jgi:hypothetical protein
VSARQTLLCVRGLSEERSHLAGLLAAALPGPVAHIRGDDLSARWVLRPLADDRHAVETVYRVLRLVVVSYLKEEYSVVVDSPFAASVDGVFELRTRDLRDIVRMAHTFRDIASGVVTLQPVGGVAPAVRAALERDEVEGEVRVAADLTSNEADAVRRILERLSL